jgi:hypothetical protein
MAQDTSKHAGADAAARADELLALGSDGDPVARLAELAGDLPGGAPALLDALGATRRAEAAPILAAVAERGESKDVRKAARRALHRLESAGIKAAVPLPRPAEPPRPIPQERRLVEVHATAADGVGTRVVWLGVERPSGGVYSYALALNDVVGMKDCQFDDTTRRRLRETIRDWQAEVELTVVPLPGDYALALVAEALALNAESGFTVPLDFQLRKGALGELPPPPADALIYRHVSRGQAFLIPDLLEQSPALLEEKEMEGWFFDHEDAIGPARELKRVRESRLVLSVEPREAREARLIDQAVDALFTPTMRRAIRRRLEETAYVFWQTGRELAARRAVAAAGALGQTGSLARHPFARALVEKSLDVAIAVEEAGIPTELLRRNAYTPIE